MRAAILKALQQRGGETRTEAPGLITASIDVRGRYQAWADIPQGYQIRYRDSAGLH